MLVMSDGGRVLARRPSDERLSAAVANLGRGDVVIVERVDEEQEGSWYVQVLMRDDNVLELEHRDGVAAEHYQTLTISREKVIEAVLGWAEGDPSWKAPFMWDNIGHWFAPE